MLFRQEIKCWCTDIRLTALLFSRSWCLFPVTDHLRSPVELVILDADMGWKPGSVYIQAKSRDYSRIPIHEYWISVSAAMLVVGLPRNRFFSFRFHRQVFRFVSAKFRWNMITRRNEMKFHTIYILTWVSANYVFMGFRAACYNLKTCWDIAKIVRETL